jgi:carboxyl-terminal processing protease
MFKKSLFIIAIICCTIFATKAQEKINNLSDYSRKVSALFQMVDDYYVDTLNESKIVDDGIRAILKDLDPHSVYIPADELKQTNEPLVGKFEGVGIQFNILYDTILVSNTVPGGPSEKLGIRSGDRIVKIEDEVVAGIKIKNNDVIKRLRGDKGTKVKVSILRRGEGELLDYVITRDKIPLFSVDASYVIAPKTGYIKISRFADSTVEEFKNALDSLKQQGIENLILDLQGNGGGYLSRAIELADEFLSDKKLVVYTEGRNNPRQENLSTSIGGWEKGRLAILVDESSASASEIVSGAIQDWDRGLIVGRRSFGKGLVQKPFGLPDGSAVRLTIARYYTPSGRCIQKSYSNGDEDYDLELAERTKRGELFYADSLPKIDSLKKFTNNKRLVYGGGGITPDLFVPLDTNMNSKYYRDLVRKGLINEYTLDYMDSHRKELLAAYSDVNTFKSQFIVDDKLMDDFFAYCDKHDLKKDEEGYKISKVIIQASIKGLIARNLWNLNAYFVILNDENDAAQAAIKAMTDKSFEKNKIAWK